MEIELIISITIVALLLFVTIVLLLLRKKKKETDKQLKKFFEDLKKDSLEQKRMDLSKLNSENYKSLNENIVIPLEFKELNFGKEKLLNKHFKRKVTLLIKVEKNYEDFTYSDAFEIITKAETLIGKQNVKLKKIEKGSTILTLELKYEDALKLVKIIQEGKLKELGISDAKVKRFMESEIYSNVLSFASTANNHSQSNSITKDFKIDNFISEMKETLTNDIEKTILLVKAKLKESSPKFNDIVMLTGKYNRLKSESIKGINEKEYSERQNSEIVNSLLKLLDSLKTDDIEN